MATSFSRLCLLVWAHPFFLILPLLWGSRFWAVCQLALYSQLRGIKPQELGVPLKTPANCELEQVFGKGAAACYWCSLGVQFNRLPHLRRYNCGSPCLPITVSLEALLPWPGPWRTGPCLISPPRWGLEARMTASDARASRAPETSAPHFRQPSGKDRINLSFALPIILLLLVKFSEKMQVVHGSLENLNF